MSCLPKCALAHLLHNLARIVAAMFSPKPKPLKCLKLLEHIRIKSISYHKQHIISATLGTEQQDLDNKQESTRQWQDKTEEDLTEVVEKTQEEKEDFEEKKHPEKEKNSE